MGREPYRDFSNDTSLCDYFLPYMNQSYRFFLFLTVYHDNRMSFLVPDHSPEILRGLMQRMLGSYVADLSFVVLKGEDKERRS